MKVKDLRNLVNAFEYLWIMTEEGELLEHGEERKLSKAYDNAIINKISPDYDSECRCQKSNYNHCKVVFCNRAEDVVIGLKIYLKRGSYILL